MDNPYEDIPDPSDPKKTGPAPSAPPKPSVAAKPKVKAASQSHYNNVEIVRQAGAGGGGGGSVVAVVPEDTYSTVSKVKSAVTPPAAQTADTDVDFPDQTRSPVVPDKHFAADDPENNNNVLAETGKAGVRAAGGAVTSEQVYNNTAYSPQDLEEDATYVNAANCSAGDNNSDKDKRASNGYYHNPDGLLYMTLASAGSAQGQGASSKSPVRHARKEEPVEYTSLKFTAQPR
ncbi:uncharacterized protein LOC106014030 [Aplysia californica]|uniref:Uncharacterized protein LOC106014030 n=1 Tax=Aplysia californica TaxID=6500 RepID=A0ABM1AF56_APLCA|nr:uncharacterized protein LOC106014030 [Aplysia californica]